MALIVFHEGILGGATLSVLRIAPLLRRCGWRLAFWAPKPSELHRHLLDAGHEVAGAPRAHSYSLRALRLPPGPMARVRSMPAYFGALRRYVRRARPALVHVNSLTTLAEAAWLRGLRLPVVAHLHEMVPPTPKGALARGAIRIVPTEAIGVSTACVDALAVGGWRPHLVYEAAPVPERQATVREGWPLRFGSVGVISRRKGTDVFVEAAALALAERPKLEFELVGAPTDPLDVEWARGVLARAAEIGVIHRRSADVAATLPSWDGFALPSRRDPFPISMLEAMAAGLPVVGSRTDGIPEQLAGGEAGMLVDTDDPEGLAAALVRLADDAGLRERLGNAGRRRVRSEFSPERQAAGIDRVWRAAVGDV